MTSSAWMAGRGLRAPSRFTVPVTAVLALFIALGGCGGGSSPPGSTGLATDGGNGEAAGAKASSGAAPGMPATGIPATIAGIELQVVDQPVGDALDAVGGAEMRAMLDGLDLDADRVQLVIGVDPTGRLAIGRWSLPDRAAGAILDAWLEVAGNDWRATTVDDHAAATGRGPDGSRAWAATRDGAFIYVATDDPELAAAALAAVR